MEMGENQIIHTILILIFFVFFCFIGYLLFRLFLFLLSKPRDVSGTGEGIGIITRLSGLIFLLFRYVKGLIRSFPRKIDDAAQGFTWLLKWGKRSGVAKAPDETPLEYAGRLQQRFEPLENEIRTIILTFQLEVYGKVSLTRDKIQQVNQSVKKIHSPSFWLLRIKSNWEK